MQLFWRSPYHYYRSALGLGDEDNVTIPGDCTLVRDYNWTERCYFVEHNDNCMDIDGMINYISILYCSFTGGLFWLGLCLYVIWLVILFIALAVSADDFFCPAIQVISDTLRLSQNVAGVTIMALGNGAPDIFSSLAGISAARPELVFGELFGAGVFVTTVVAGSVAITKPFKVMERPFLRDVSFYLMAGFWAFYIFWRGQIRLSDSLGFLGLYLAYILVVVFGRVIHNRIRTSVPYAEQVNDDRPGSDDATAQIATNPAGVQYPTTTGTPPEVRLLPQTATPLPVRGNLYKLLHSINPVQSEEWTESNLFWKLYILLKAPLDVLFRLTIPRVDPEEPAETWCQYLVLIQCVLTPLFTVFATSTALDRLGDTDIQVYQVVLVVSPLLAIIVAFTSRSSQPPVYNPVFAFVGFIVSIVWIYIIANELVTLLKAFGVALGLTDAILGLTVLAWGNSIGDLIADTAMAKRGHPRTGFSACFGGPLFNLLLGIGLPFTIQILGNGGAPVDLDFNLMTLTLSVGLGSALLFSFLLLPLMKFMASRLYGAGLLVIYVVFLAICIVIEFTLM